MGKIDIVHPMEPRYLKSFLSPSVANKELIECFVNAITKYNNAVIEAGKVLASDLKKCEKHKVRVKKVTPKKKL
jgi:hypothetical protein